MAKKLVNVKINVMHSANKYIFRHTLNRGPLKLAGALAQDNLALNGGL